MRNSIFSSLLLIIALVSCAPSSTATPAPAAIISVSPTTKSTSSITATVKPSATLTPTANKTPHPTVESYAMASKISPNGEYNAYAYFYNGTEQQTIEIKDRQGKLMWKVPYQGQLPHGDPRTTIGIYRWSNDSSQLYFCYYWSPDGGDIFVKESCQGLQKINIKTGEIQPVLLESYVAFAISLDETQIAYIGCQDKSCVVHVRHQSTGIEKTAYVIAKNSIAIGSMEWSPNDSGLAYVTQDNNHMVQTIYLNLATMKQKVVKENPIFDFSGWAYFEGWTDNDTLEFTEAGRKETIVVSTPTPSN